MARHGSPDLSSSPQESPHTFQVPRKKSNENIDAFLAQTVPLWSRIIKENTLWNYKNTCEVKHIDEMYLFANFSARTGASGTVASLSARFLQQQEQKHSFRTVKVCVSITTTRFSTNENPERVWIRDSTQESFNQYQTNGSKLKITQLLKWANKCIIQINWLIHQ